MLVFKSWFSLLVGIRRARLICGGQVVEDIDGFNRDDIYDIIVMIR